MRRAVLLAAVLFVGVPAAGLELPPEIPRGDRVVFYLHGRIVEDQGPEATSDAFGRYEYVDILDALGGERITLLSEVRPAGTDPWEYARLIANRIRELKSRGVPPGHIAVVGASKGAGIAVLASHLVRDPEVRYVLLGSCAAATLDSWKREGVCASGRILAIFDGSDRLAGPCDDLVDRCPDGVAEYREIRTDLGQGHGLLYRPYEEWVMPARRWCRGGAPEGGPAPRPE